MSIHEFAIPKSPHGIGGLSLVFGPDHNVWFTLDSGFVGRVTATGSFRLFAVPFSPVDIAAGPDRALWVTGAGGPIARVSLGGQITAYSKGLAPGALPTSIARGRDGNLWFTDSQGGPDRYNPAPGPYVGRDRIGRITPSGAITEYQIGDTYDHLYSGITAGRDGNMWFTYIPGGPLGDAGPFGIGRITPAGRFALFPAPGSLQPTELLSQSDGSLWFVDGNAGGIATITTSGHYRRHQIRPTGRDDFAGYTQGPDGHLWITTAIPNRLFCATTTGRVLTSVSRGFVPGTDNAQIISGAHRTLWFVSQNPNSGHAWIGRISLGKHR